jgi:hypothetical protein
MTEVGYFVELTVRWALARAGSGMSVRMGSGFEMRHCQVTKPDNDVDGWSAIV